MPNIWSTRNWYWKAYSGFHERKNPTAILCIIYIYKINIYFYLSKQSIVLFTITQTAEDNTRDRGPLLFSKLTYNPDVTVEGLLTDQKRIHPLSQIQYYHRFHIQLLSSLSAWCVVSTPVCFSLTNTDSLNPCYLWKSFTNSRVAKQFGEQQPIDYLSQINTFLVNFLQVHKTTTLIQ